MKIKQIQAHIKAAKAYGDLSHSKRLKVGAVIIRDNRPIAVGYNGRLSNAGNECEEIINGELVTRRDVVHAECNAIAFAAKYGVSTDGADIFLTHSPCFECSKIIIQAGIKSVWYEKVYRDETSIKFLRESGVITNKIGDNND